MIDITEVQGGILIAVKAQPGARRNAIMGVHAGSLKVAVTQKPENGKANEAIVALLAKQLSVPKRNCSVRVGLTSRNKRLFVADITAMQAIARLGLE